MNDTRKPREFWIDPYDGPGILSERHKDMTGVVHVIEYSAYEKLQGQFDQLKSSNQDMFNMYEAHRKERDEYRAWMSANIPEMECRGDEDCDHCLGRMLLAKYPKEFK